MTETTKKAAESAAEVKAKYGRIYRVTVDVPDEEGALQQKTYIFKKPVAASYDRYLQSVPGGQVRALKTLVRDNLLEEYQDQLTADLEEYPGLLIPLGNKLLDMLGVTGAAAVKKL